MKRYVLALIVLSVVACQAVGQNLLLKSSVAEVKVSGQGQSASLFTNRALLTYNENSGEFRCTLNIATFNEDPNRMLGNSWELETLSPSDSSLIIFTAITSRNQLEPTGTPTDAITLQMPGYLVYRDIQQSVIADYSYGATMTPSNQQIYLNLFVRAANDEANLMRFPQLNFVPEDIRIEIVDGFVNRVSQ